MMLAHSDVIGSMHIYAYFWSDFDVDIDLPLPCFTMHFHMTDGSSLRCEKDYLNPWL